MYGKNSSGIGLSPLIDTDRKLVIAQSGGKYAEAAMAGRLFSSANINMVATNTTLHTTFIGLGLCNPTGSGKNVIVHEFGWAMVVAAGAATVISLATTTDSGITVQDANCPIKCARNGYATSVCYTTEGATIVAPVIIKVITQGANTNINTIGARNQVFDLDGGIILVPGRSIVTDTTTAMAASGAQFSFMWEEVDA